MPIYEEKLICPLAVRFTQEHIRPVFQDGLSVEATIKAIKTRPGSGGYDVILEAPFPAIEIIRWHQPDSGRREPDAKHWFTLDNRRLYCLQRRAAALWPRVVGVAVEVLYRATEGILRKDDSSTVGRSVGIGHSLKALTGRWDWREAVSGACNEEAAAKAFERLAEDDRKASVSELQDASSGPCSALERLHCFCEAEETESAGQGEAHGAGSDASTTSPRTFCSRHDSDGSEPGPGGAWNLEEWFAGTWQGDKGEYYEIRCTGRGAFVCWRTGEAGSKRFTFWHDEAGGVIWWGTNYSLYMDTSQFAGRPGEANWYNAQDTQMRWPRFTWQKLETAKDADDRPHAKQPATARRQPPQQRREAAPSSAGSGHHWQGGGGSRWVPVQAGHKAQE